MIDTLSIATDGIHPNWNPWLVVLKGFGFDLEVVIAPQKPYEGGGSWGPDNSYWESAQQHLITIKVKYRGKTWEQTTQISSLSVRSLEKVMSSFRRMTTKTVEVYGKLKSIFTPKITVKIKADKYNN